MIFFVCVLHKIRMKSTGIRTIQSFISSKQFNHLESVGQTYTEHFSDSMNYSWNSLKSSFYFFCHGFYPDVFETSGSNTVSAIVEKIQQKHSSCTHMNKIRHE